MATKNYLSPHGVPIVGTLERVDALGRISGISDKGEPDFSGDTEVFWDTQTTVRRDGEIVFLDEDGGEWLFYELTPKPDEEEDDGA